MARTGDKYPIGSNQGKVRNLTEFGAFVEVEEEIDGPFTSRTCRGASASSIRPKC